MAERLNISRTQNRYKPQRLLQRPLSQNQTIQSKFEEQKVLNENKVRINDAVYSFANSFSNINQMKAEANNYYSRNVSNIDPKLKGYFQEVLKQSVTNKINAQNQNISKINSEIKKWKKITETTTKANTDANYRTRVREATDLINRMKAGEILNPTEVINYSVKSGSIAGSSVSKQVKQIEYSKLVQEKARLEQSKAQELASIKSSQKAKVPTIQELALEKKYGTQSIAKPKIVVSAPGLGYSIPELNQSVMFSPNLTDVQKARELEIAKRDLNKSFATGRLQQEQDFKIETQRVAKENFKLQLQQAKEIQPEVVRLVKEVREYGTRVISTQNIKNPVLKKVGELYNSVLRLRYNPQTETAFTRAQKDIKNKLNNLDTKKYQTLAEINTIKNPYVRGLLKLKNGLQTIQRERELGFILGVINWGEGWYNIPYLIANVDKIRPKEVIKGITDYVYELGYLVGSKPVAGLTRLVTEVGLDLGTDILITNIIKGIKPIKNKIEVEKLAGAYLLNDNKLVLKTYKEFADKIPETTKYVDGVLRGKLLYYGDNLQVKFTIYDINGKRIAYQTNLLGQNKLYKSAISKGDDVVKRLNQLVEVKQVDFIAQARIDLKGKSINVIRGQLKNLPDDVWKTIKNQVNEKVVIRKGQTREGTFGIKETSLQKKIMSQADQERLRKVFDDAMKRKPDGITPKSRQIEFKNIKIKITQDKFGKLLIDIPDDYINQFSKLEIAKEYRFIKQGKQIQVLPKRTALITTKNQLPVLRKGQTENIFVKNEAFLREAIKKNYDVIEVKKLDSKTFKVKITGKPKDTSTQIMAQFEPRDAVRKKVYEEFTSSSNEFKKIALKRKQLTSELQNLKRIQRKIKNKIKLLPYEKRLLITSRFKIKQTILPDGRRLIEIPDLDDIYLKKINDVTPDKYKTEIQIIKAKEQAKIPTKTEIYKEVVNSDGTILLQKLAPQEVKQIPKLKQKTQTLQLSRQEALSQLNERLRNKQKARQKTLSQQKQAFVNKLNDPVIAYKVIKDNRAKLGTLTIGLKELSRLLSRPKLDSMTKQSLRYQQAQKKAQKQRLEYEIKKAKDSLNDKIIGYKKAQDTTSVLALRRLLDVIPVNIPAHEYVKKIIEDIKIKIGSVKKTKVPEIKLSWKTPLKEKDLNYMTNGLVKVDNNIKEIKLRTTPYRAFKYMIKLIDNTTSRSFALKIVGLIRKKDIPKPNLKKFRSKFGKNPLVLQFVELSKYSIDTAGEKRGLKVSKYLKSKRR